MKATETTTLCDCGSRRERFAVYDGYGIFLFYCCQYCYLMKRSKYRDDIFTRYETNEQIEPEV